MTNQRLQTILNAWRPEMNVCIESEDGKVWRAIDSVEWAETDAGAVLLLKPAVEPEKGERP